jgi:hypothetical protein
MFGSQTKDISECGCSGGSFPLLTSATLDFTSPLNKTSFSTWPLEIGQMVPRFACGPTKMVITRNGMFLGLKSDIGHFVYLNWIIEIIIERLEFQCWLW